MTSIKTAACAAALLFAPLFASPVVAQARDHGAAGQSQTPQGQSPKPQEVPCPMMQRHDGMKMDGKAMPQGGAQHPTTGNVTGGTTETKCMHHGAAATPTPAPAPEEQHNHDHPPTSKPR